MTGPGVRKDVWVSYTPQATGVASFTLSGSPVDAVVSVHTGCGDMVATSDVTNGGQATVGAFAVTAGTTYLVRAAGPKDLSDETFDLVITGPGTRKDIWYSYTPRADGMADFTLSGSAVDAVLSIHTGTATVDVDCDITNGGQASVTDFAVTADTTYQIRVAGPKGGAQTMSLTIDGPGVRRDVWYSYTPQATGTADFSLANSPVDAVLSVHTSCGTVSATADATNGGQASVSSFAVTAGTTYLIRAAGPKNLSDETFDLVVAGPGTRKDVWFSYVPRASGNADFTLSGSPADAVISIHTASPTMDLASDITNGGQASVAGFAVTADTTYFVRAAGAMDGGTPNFSVVVDGPGVRRDVWYAYTPQADGTADFELTGSPTDAILSIHTSCGTISSDADITSGTDQAEVTDYAVTAGTNLPGARGRAARRWRSIVRSGDRGSRDAQGYLV